MYIDHDRLPENCANVYPCILKRGIREHERARTRIRLRAGQTTTCIAVPRRALLVSAACDNTLGYYKNH